MSSSRVSDLCYVSNCWFAPEELFREEICQDFYKNHPYASRAFFSPLMLVTGAAKPLLFPLMALVGVVALPIIALVASRQGNSNLSIGALKATGWCSLSLASMVALVMLHTYFFPMMLSTTLVITAVGISIGIHVFRAFQEPQANIAHSLLAEHRLKTYGDQLVIEED